MMVSTIEVLLNRSSAGKLTSPAPEGDALRQIQRAALTAPDHGYLRPWRFLTVQDKARFALGRVFLSAGLAENPSLSPEKQEKLLNNPLRAPLLVVVIACIKSSEKVPAVEQRLSAGCAAHAMLQAAHALGFAGIWRTGAMAYDPQVKAALGLGPGEEIVGYLYLGTRAGDPKPQANLVIDDYWQDWSGH